MGPFFPQDVGDSEGFLQQAQYTTRLIVSSPPPGVLNTDGRKACAVTRACAIDGNQGLLPLHETNETPSDVPLRAQTPQWPCPGLPRPPWFPSSTLAQTGQAGSRAKVSHLVCGAKLSSSTRRVRTGDSIRGNDGLDSCLLG